MALPVTIKFGKFRVLLGSGVAPYTYAAPCGFNSKSLTLSKDMTDVTLPDCTDPDAVAWIGRDAASLSASVSGEGVLAVESADTWLDAWESITSTPIKIEAEFPAVTITWTGFMHVATFAISAEIGGRATANVEMQSDGQLVRTSTP